MKVTPQAGQTVIGVYVVHARLAIDTTKEWLIIPPFHIEANSVKEVVEKLREPIDNLNKTEISIEVTKIEKGPITGVKTNEEREQADSIAHHLYLKLLRTLRGQ